MNPRRASSQARAVGLAAAAAVLAGAVGVAGGLPASQLEVMSRGGWLQWWRSDRAPSAWRAPDPAVAGAVTWQPAAAGMEWGELHLAGTGEAWRLLVILVRLDPARLRLELTRAGDEGETGPGWALDDLPAGAVLGVNAGQFAGDSPWGWLVRHGRVEQRAGRGPLSMAMCVLAGGQVAFLPVTEIPVAGAGQVRDAFQSYPILLVGDGEVPPELRRADHGVDVGHRDVRLAVGELRDGRILIALTRFAAAGETLGSLPFGPTVPEMTAIAGALGCRQAVALDGGISAQLALRDASGAWHAWRGWRRVPLALVAFPRPERPDR